MEHMDIVKVIMVKEGKLPIPNAQITCAEEAAYAFRKYLEGADREHFVIAMLNTKHFITGLHTVSIGSLDASIVHPREVYKAALLANAAAILCAHNHPSGDHTPSPEDLSVTKRLYEAGKILGIDLLDHLILGEPGFTSLAQLGHLS